jgi:group I intron endonuclease
MSRLGKPPLRCCKECRKGISRIYRVVLDSETRYVGQTTHSLNCRLGGHISRARRTGRKTPFICWIRSILNTGLQPRIELIEEVLEMCADEREIFWIKEYRKAGLRLLNYTDGGNMCGMRGKRHTEEARMIMSKLATGRKMCPDAIERGAAKRRGRKQSDEEKEKRASKLRGRKLSDAQKRLMSIRMLRDAITKPVVKINPDTGEEIKFRSVRDAAKATNSSHPNISRAAKNPNYTCAGFKWRYADANS